ncbi:MAG: aldo/keto reductase [Deferrisomatales bacterium]
MAARGLTRRRFLALSAAVPAAGLVPGATAAAPGPTLRTLGRTGLRVSEVGMGVMISSDPALVRAALDAGVTYFDTARSYMGGRNEEILAEGLGDRRREAVIATKCHALGSVGRVVGSAEQSLKALATDAIDVFQLHGLADRDQVLRPEHLRAVEALKRAGKIRFAGVSTHTNMAEVLDAAVEAKAYDVVLTSLNFQSPPEVLAAAKRAAAAGVGVVAMKIMSGGYAMAPFPGLNPYQSALRWVLEHDAVATTIPSMATFDQVRENAAVMGTRHTWRDAAALELYAGAVEGRYCRGCNACAGQCRLGADVPGALRAAMYAQGYGRPDLAREALAAAPLPCNGCGRCTVTCRFGLPVADRIALALAAGGAVG